MSDKKMLQAIINGQSALKQELFSRIDALDKKIDSAEDSLLMEIRKNGKSIDKLGY